MPDTACQIEGPFRPEILSESDIPECVQLVVQNFGLQQTIIRQWFERRITCNPWQKSLPGIGVGIRRSGRLIAFRALFGQPWWIKGRSTTLAFGGHTVVDLDYRHHGLATRLISESKNFSALTGSATAGNITQKAFKKLGYSEVGETDNDFFRARISYRGSMEKRIGKKLGTLLGRIADVLLEIRDPKIAPGAKFYMDEVFRCDHEFDHLWERTKADYVSCLERTSNYLNWRLFDYPTWPLHLASLRDSSGTLRAYGIWHVQAFDEIVKMGVLRDVFCAMKDPEAFHGLLRLLFDRWREEGISWASLEVASPWITAFFRDFGYEHVPSHGNRYQIHSQFPLPAEILRNWLRSGIDGDYFDLPAS